jgi:hypothetical protein
MSESSIPKERTPLLARALDRSNAQSSAQPTTMEVDDTIGDNNNDTVQATRRSTVRQEEWSRLECSDTNDERRMTITSIVVLATARCTRRVYIIPTEYGSDTITIK